MNERLVNGEETSEPTLLSLQIDSSLFQFIPFIHIILSLLFSLFFFPFSPFHVPHLSFVEINR